jgi:hypothetical protein
MPVIPGIMASHKPLVSAYDTMVLAFGADLQAYWKLGSLDLIVYSSYDVAVLALPDLQAYWKLGSIDPVTGASYDTIMLGISNLLAFWPLDDID